MSQIPVEKTVFTRDFSKIIDTDFKQLINNNQEIPSEFTLDDFFRLYEQMFYQIQKDGDVNSHNYILNREANYLGIKLANETDVDELLQEITQLRQELLDANKTINDLNG